MKFEENLLYHIYNQSNGNNIIFKSDSDYLRFLDKIRKWVYPNCNILAYCVMPDHYHFLIEANTRSIAPLRLGALTTNELSNAFRITQSQYAQYFNTKYRHSGAVFRPKTKSKELNGSRGYPLACFIYIHQNPLKARLSKTLVDWKYSSALDYVVNREGTIINKGAAKKYIDIRWEQFTAEMESLTPDPDTSGLFKS